MMPALNFDQRFASAVESGQKRQAIRAWRRHPWRVGDTLYLFAGQRSSACRCLGQATLLSVQQIQIDVAHYEIRLETQSADFSYLAPLPPEAALELARADGFASLGQFFEFFTQPDGRGLSGHLLKW
jgi:hypothetical protein